MSPLLVRSSGGGGGGADCTFPVVTRWGRARLWYGWLDNGKSDAYHTGAPVRVPVGRPVCHALQLQLPKSHSMHGMPVQPARGETPKASVALA